MNKMDGIATADLVNELMFREGVEFIMVSPSSKCGITINNGSGVTVYSSQNRGPEIIFRIID